MEILIGIGGAILAVFAAWWQGRKSGRTDAQNEQRQDNEQARADDAKIRDDVNRTDVDDLRDELRKQSKR